MFVSYHKNRQTQNKDSFFNKMSTLTAACNPVSPFFSTTTFDKSPIEGRYPVGTIATFSCQFGERLRELRYDATRATVCSAGNSFTNTPTGCEPGKSYP